MLLPESSFDYSRDLQATLLGLCCRQKRFKMADLHPRESRLLSFQTVGVFIQGKYDVDDVDKLSSTANHKAILPKQVVSFLDHFEFQRH